MVVKGVLKKSPISTYQNKYEEDKCRTHIVFFVLLFYTFFVEPVGKYYGGLRKSTDRIKLFYFRQWVMTIKEE